MTGQPWCANESSLASRAAGLMGGGRHSPDLMPSWQWAAGSPKDALLELWALSIKSTGLTIWGASGRMCSILRWETPKHMPLKTVWLTTAENKEQPRGWHLHHLTFDMKGII